MLHFSVCTHIWLFIITLKLNKVTLQAVFDKWGCVISSPNCWDAKSGTVTTHVHDLLLQQAHFTSGYLCIQFIRCLHYCFLHCPLRVHMLPAEQICFCLNLISQSVKPSTAAPSSNCRQVKLHLPFKWRTGSATLEMAVEPHTVEPDTKKRVGWVGGGWDSNTQISCKRIVSVGWVREKKTCAPGQQCVIAKGRSKQSTAQRQRDLVVFWSVNGWAMTEFELIFDLMNNISFFIAFPLNEGV